jgi:lysyl-tRNA synthetase class 2
MAHARYDGPWRSAKDPESALIYKWAYIRRTREFLVRFWNSDALYVYKGVALEIINEFVDAPSRGRYFNNHVKESYRYKRLAHFFRRLPRRETAS